MTNYDVEDNDDDEDDNDYDVEDDDNDENGKTCLFHISTVCLHISHSLNVSKTKIEILLKNKFFLTQIFAFIGHNFTFLDLFNICALYLSRQYRWPFYPGTFPECERDDGSAAKLRLANATTAVIWSRRGEGRGGKEWGDVSWSIFNTFSDWVE